MEALLREHFATVAEMFGADATDEQLRALHEQARILLVRARQDAANQQWLVGENNRLHANLRALQQDVRELEREEVRA